jgi:RND family efflux transporter MFP subunit
MSQTETQNATRTETHNTTEMQVQTPARAGGPRKGLLVVALCFVVVLAFGIWEGIRSRAQASAEVQNSTEVAAIPTVTVVRPRSSKGVQEVVAPGNMQAFIDTPIWARTNGYLKNWYADIGTHVKAGQLLADIESPETDQQLQQANEELSTAQANLKLAEITADRYNGLFKSDSVAKQDVDNAVQDAAAKAATVRSAEANVRRLQQLVSYEKVFAPFDGVVTARNIDRGALIDSGANTPGKELFHMASTTTLRVFVSVPEAYAQAARPGVHGYLTLGEFPGRKFPGRVARTSDAIDPASRTLLVEVDVPNETGELLPGSYVSVHLALPSKVSAVAVPANTLLFRSEGLRVAVVRGDRVVLSPVTIGHDYGEEVELISGVSADDRIIVNPSDSITAGQRVHVSSQGS